MNPIQKVIQVLTRRGDRASESISLSREWMAPVSAPKGSILHTINRRYVYRSELAIDALERAITAALDPNIPDREELYRIYEEVQRKDARYRTVRQTRIENVLKERITLVNESGQVNEQAEQLLRQRWFYDFCYYAMDSIFWGHSLIELDRVREGNLGGCRLIPRMHVRPEYGDILLELPGNTKVLPYRGNEARLNLIEIGEADELGLLEIISFYSIHKLLSFSDWSKRSEKYGMPFLIVKTSTMKEAELRAKAQMAANFGANAWAILDDQDQIELKESTNQAPHVIYQQMKKECDDDITMIVLGQTMTTEDGSSLSQAEVHERVMNAITLADMRWLEFTLNEKLIPWMERQGLPVGGHRFAYYMNTQAYQEEQAEKVQAMQQAAARTQPQPNDSREEELSKKKSLIRSARG